MEIEKEIELLTPFGAVVLFGRSSPTVRLATREGKVRTEIAFCLESRPVRLITLKSAIEYWSTDYIGFESELRHLHDGSFVLEVHGKRYRVLHPTGMLATRDPNTDTEIWFRGL